MSGGGREGTGKPLLLRLAPLVLGFVGLQLLVFGFFAMRPMEQGQTVMFGRVLSSAWDFRVAAFVTLVMGGLLLAAAWGFWAERPWARSLTVGWGVIVTLGSFVAGAQIAGPIGGLGMALSPLVLTALVWGYLYEGKRVEAYYAGLEAEDWGDAEDAGDEEVAEDAVSGAPPAIDAGA